MLLSVCQGTDLKRQYCRLDMRCCQYRGVHSDTQALSATSALAKESTVSDVMLSLVIVPKRLCVKQRLVTTRALSHKHVRTHVRTEVADTTLLHNPCHVARTRTENRGQNRSENGALRSGLRCYDGFLVLCLAECVTHSAVHDDWVLAAAFSSSSRVRAGVVIFVVHELSPFIWSGRNESDARKTSYRKGNEHLH